MRAFALMGLLIFAAGCGGAPARPTRAQARPAAVRATTGSVELTLRRPDGSFIEVGDLRGNVVLLFLFATFDAMSQLVLHPLRAVAEERQDVRVIGIAAQEGARLLVDPYEHALSPPFVVTYDPEERVLTPESPLGPLEAVPTFIVLDRRGVPVARHVGALDAPQLRALLSAAH